ncbi:MAG: (Fe-S)-binding protein [Flavobacteriales bacterium]|nr:(Fe-S)-binding protein [Flavobacteriales bacterium]
MIEQISFGIVFVLAIFFFVRSVRKITRNIKLGRDIDLTDNRSERLMTMVRVALGQSKMGARPVAGFMHFLVYIGFILINIEVLEIVIDGIAGTHRVLSFMGGFYDFVIGFFEILAVLTILACAVFLVRRNVIKIKRFWNREMSGWPSSDANIILFTEIALMIALLTMNATDYLLQGRGADHYIEAGSFPISKHWAVLFAGMTDSTLIGIERFCWWFHIVGILGFLNYLPISKHFHIILAFPNTYFSNLKKKGQFTNLESVKKEVEIMFDPNADPYAAPPEPDPNAEPVRFGAKDVQDLTWKQLMDSYTCTECGRCTSECPANQTGKLLSPRKIMMSTRDRLDEVGKNIDKNGRNQEDGKSLLHDYITPEELWACTSCNACVQACPVNIDPLSIIVDLRRYLVMEESAAPQELNMMSTNIENNGAPWQMSMADRFNWATEE